MATLIFSPATTHHLHVFPTTLLDCGITFGTMEFPAEGDHTKHGTVLEQHQSFHDCEGVDTDAQITGGRSLSSPPLVEDLFPGLRDNDGHPSEGADDILDVIKLLNVATIPVCIVGVNALRYYGAGRVVWVGQSLPCISLITAIFAHKLTRMMLLRNGISAYQMTCLKMPKLSSKAMADTKQPSRPRL